MGSIQGKMEKKTAAVGRAADQEVFSGHLQRVMDIVSLICGCINGDLNVEKLEGNGK